MKRNSLTICCTLILPVIMLSANISVGDYKFNPDFIRKEKPKLSDHVLKNIAKLTLTRITEIRSGKQNNSSRSDGTSTVKLVVSGVNGNSGNCRYRLNYKGPEMNETEFKTVSPSLKLPHVINLELKYPGRYYFKVFGDSGKPCKGKAGTTIEVKAHPKYPCGQYPGYKKAKFGRSVYCVPIKNRPNNIKKISCEQYPGTIFRRLEYTFGCFDPLYLKALCQTYCSGN